MKILRIYVLAIFLLPAAKGSSNKIFVILIKKFQLFHKLLSIFLHRRRMSKVFHVWQHRNEAFERHWT